VASHLPDNVFIRFANLLRAISVLPAGVSLDPQEERLLLELAVRWSKNEGVPVLAAMAMVPDASASTVQRRLKSLRSKGLIAFEPHPQDARVRHVVPTAQGKTYFARMGELMQEAAGRG
jgi:DNA-binding MarR family transcriptional regulator